MEAYGITVLGSFAGGFLWNRFGLNPPAFPPNPEGGFSFEMGTMMSDHRLDPSWLVLPIVLPVAIRLHMRRAFLPVFSVLVALLGASVMIRGSIGGVEYLPADVVRFLVSDNVGMFGTRAIIAGAFGGAWAFFRSGR